MCGLKLCILWLLYKEASSHPAWVCGLKQWWWLLLDGWCEVTPCVGVWIETFTYYRVKNRNSKSHPAWVCGLKLTRNLKFHCCSSHTLRGCVDWNIPMIIIYNIVNGHTLRGCVDWNFHKTVQWSNESMSHPAWVCGLKLYPDRLPRYQTPSHPAWVCGLKLRNTEIINSFIVSHPAWVCGLKPDNIMYVRMYPIVTPCVGVWIETGHYGDFGQFHGVTPCVGVYGLKHCSLVGQVYGRIVSIRPLVYFSSSCYKVKSQTKYVRLLTLLWLEKTRTIPDAYLLSVFFCGFT